MSEDRPLFILAGNAPYVNQGCEAITRGTVKILRNSFGSSKFVCTSHFQSEQQYQEQKRKETDGAITHTSYQYLNKKMLINNFWKPVMWKGVYQHITDRGSMYSWGYYEMLPYLKDASAVLSVGGDNYTLDYGIPRLFTGLDDLVIAHKKPIVLWGASVGPFSAMPDYERYMSSHLKNITCIFARESATVQYLKSIGVTDNVYPVGDPAFLMDPVKPTGIDDEMPIEKNAMGLNLSPLMAKFVTGGNLDQWAKISASIIETMVMTFESPIYLIPHVTWNGSGDHSFMQRVVKETVNIEKGKLVLVPPKYNAAETKWIISQMAVFTGARTHSTIAALSSYVPTLSLAYSIKAQGINKDIFGHMDYCLNPEDINAKAISDRIQVMLDRKAIVRKDLSEQIPKIQKVALDAGMKLRQITGGI